MFSQSGQESLFNVVEIVGHLCLPWFDTTGKIYTGPTGIPRFLQHGDFRTVFHTVSVCSAIAFVDPTRITEKSRERCANDKSYNEVHLVASKKLRITKSHDR